jgi:hypothetical protein
MDVPTVLTGYKRGFLSRMVWPAPNFGNDETENVFVLWKS